MREASDKKIGTKTLENFENSRRHRFRFADGRFNKSLKSMQSEEVRHGRCLRAIPAPAGLGIIDFQNRDLVRITHKWQRIVERPYSMAAAVPGNNDNMTHPDSIGACRDNQNRAPCSERDIGRRKSRRRVWEDDILGRLTKHREIRHFSDGQHRPEVGVRDAVQ